MQNTGQRVRHGSWQCSRSAGRILQSALAVGCDQALQIAKNQGILSTHEKKSAFISHLFTDHLLSIEKNLAFLIVQRKLDIQAVLDFEEKYRQQVAERHNSIRPPFIEAAKDVPISKLYVPSAIGAGSRSRDNSKQHQTISMDAFLGTIYRAVLLGSVVNTEVGEKTIEAEQRNTPI